MSGFGEMSSAAGEIRSRPPSAYRSVKCAPVLIVACETRVRGGRPLRSFDRLVRENRTPIYSYYYRIPLINYLLGFHCLIAISPGFTGLLWSSRLLVGINGIYWPMAIGAAFGKKVSGNALWKYYSACLVLRPWRPLALRKWRDGKGAANRKSSSRPTSPRSSTRASRRRASPGSSASLQEAPARARRRRRGRRRGRR